MLTMNLPTVTRILRSISRALESLLSIGGLESFFLAVDPYDPTDEGFLGGTLLGREFWRGHRGCGAAGARAFQTHCQKSIAGQLPLPQEVPAYPIAVPPTSHIHVPVVQPTNAVKKSPASTLKTEVYASVRNALRSVIGICTGDFIRGLTSEASVLKLWTSCIQSGLGCQER